MSGLFERASAMFQELQGDICRRLETLDGVKQFGADRWDRAAGGGGVARVLDGGAVFRGRGRLARGHGGADARRRPAVPGYRGVAGDSPAIADGADDPCQLPDDLAW
jgi:coproporphyrinogen III oxidase